MSAEALTPPPECLNRRIRAKILVFSSCIKVYVFETRPETDDFVIQKYLAVKEKILLNISRNNLVYTKTFIFLS